MLMLILLDLIVASIPRVPHDFELLKTLVTKNGKIVLYDFILSRVWDDEDNAERKNIHVYINRLRKKIETPSQCRFIYNEAKAGYRFQADI